jgi:hypothetical protein
MEIVLKEERWVSGWCGEMGASCSVDDVAMVILFDNLDSNDVGKAEEITARQDGRFTKKMRYGK